MAEKQFDTQQELYEIETLLAELPEMIATQSGLVNTENMNYRTAKAEYELKQAQIIMTVKAHYPDKTQTDLDAEATVGTHAERLAMILAESKYKSEQSKLHKLQNEMELVKERSFNMRQNMKSFGGGH